MPDPNDLTPEQQRAVVQSDLATLIEEFGEVFHHGEHGDRKLYLRPTLSHYDTTQERVIIVVRSDPADTLWKFDGAASLEWWQEHLVAIPEEPVGPSPSVAAALAAVTTHRRTIETATADGSELAGLVSDLTSDEVAQAAYAARGVRRDADETHDVGVWRKAFTEAYSATVEQAKASEPEPPADLPEDSFVVVCQEQGRTVLSSRQVFAARNIAEIYAASCAASRKAAVVAGRFAELRLPEGSDA